MTGEKAELFPRIESSLEGIKTCDDLLKFVDLLAEGVEAKIFEEQAVINYIEGIALVLFGFGKSAPENPDWRLFGRVLLSAFFR
jgi:hypothetical protein